MFTVKQFVGVLSAPGVKGPIEETAPTQHVVPVVAAAGPGGKNDVFCESVAVQNVTGFVPKSKGRRLDRWLDRWVQASGSEPVFLFILLSLFTWVFLGIPFGKSQDWAVVISDAQAIVSYMFDSLLMRQQLNSYGRLVRVSAILRSRAISNRKMIRQIARAGRHKIVAGTHSESILQNEHATAAQLPAENMVGRVSTLASRLMGHVITVGLFWVGVFVWLGFGVSMQWSDSWQLYINSATSALMVLIFAFLANIRERHNIYMERWLDLIFEVDSKVELKLRTITGYATPNPTVVIPGPKVSKIQRIIFYYADIVGTLVGIAILIFVMIVWLCLGPLMSFDSNWWLLIGTYAGLVGLHDGFVLRNVQDRLNEYENAAFEEASLEDVDVFADAGIPNPQTDRAQENSISHRISTKMGVICAHEMTVVLGVLLIVGLLVGSSVMGWTETGQLLCNVPPSIIESFFMMILITAHNISESRRRSDLRTVYLRRLRLLAYVDGLEAVQTD